MTVQADKASSVSSLWSPVRVVVGLAVSGLFALVVGVPTGIIETSWYSRMTPVLWWNYPVWIASSLLAGALVATYVRVPDGVKADQQSKSFGGGVLSFFAVGCPICNKLVVLALGVNGAMTWFAPIQPVIAAASLGLLAYALRTRLLAYRSCPIPARP